MKLSQSGETNFFLKIGVVINNSFLNGSDINSFSLINF